MPLKKITEPFLIVCEGTADEAFLRHLLADRTVNGFQITYPTGKYHGKTGFHSELATIKGIRGFNKLRLVLIVRDTDDDPEQALRETQDQISGARDYDVPTELLVPSARVANTPEGPMPPVVIITIPWADEAGNLESLLMKAVPDYFEDTAACLNAYFDCLPEPKKWRVGPQDKMRFACVIASLCAEDPTCTATYIWSEDKTDVFRPMLRHTCFNQLVDFFVEMAGQFQGEEVDAEESAENTEV